MADTYTELNLGAGLAVVKNHIEDSSVLKPIRTDLLDYLTILNNTVVYPDPETGFKIVEEVDCDPIDPFYDVVAVLERLDNLVIQPDPHVGLAVVKNHTANPLADRKKELQAKLERLKGINVT